MGAAAPRSPCPGCGALLPVVDGPVHDYMTSSPACWALFGRVLACEYSDPALLPVHRLSVDTYAVQHPGSGRSRAQIQSVGLHLARLGLQVAGLMPPRQANDVMLALGRHKATLAHLDPPRGFAMTVAGTKDHAAKVTEWAQATWADWSAHHAYIRDWTAKRL